MVVSRFHYKPENSVHFQNDFKWTSANHFIIHEHQERTERYLGILQVFVADSVKFLELFQ